MPYTQMSIWFLLAYFLKNKRWKKVFFILGIGYLFFFSNRFIVNEALLLWEVPPTPIRELDTHYEVGIVLGGMVNSKREPKDRVYFYRGVDRINHAIQLYKRGIVRKILVSGGSGSMVGDQQKEADDLARYLLMCEVKKEDILVENKSRNTYENALYSTRILKNEGLDNKKLLLFTSASHLRRAILCFEKMDLDVEGFSTDFYGNERSFTPDRLFIPDPTAFSDWQMIIKEIEGLIFYRLAGYI
jgi:uncharacterized SAM-binding protein YcdF (DUF218 family)